MCLLKEDLIKFFCGITSRKGEGKMNDTTRIAKSVALFATLIGVYTWIGQGASFVDILIVLFAAMLILSVESEVRETPVLPLEVDESHNQNSFFNKMALPLRQCFLTWREHFLSKTLI